MIKMLWEAKEFNIFPVNIGKEMVASSIIQIEKIHAPILIFSTKADTVWPSYESGLKLCERLQKAQYPYPCKHVSFEHMSHMMLENCGEDIKYFLSLKKKEAEEKRAEEKLAEKKQAERRAEQEEQEESRQSVFEARA